MAEANKKTSAKKPAVAEEPLTPEELYQKAESILKADELILDKPYRVDNFKTAAKYFKQAGKYEDAPERVKECLAKAEEAKTAYLTEYYENGTRILDSASTPDEFEAARRFFKKIPGYKDADELLVKCDELEEKQALKKARKNKIILAACAAVVAAVVIFFNTPVWDKITGKVKPIDTSVSQEKAADENASEGNSAKGNAAGDNTSEEKQKTKNADDEVPFSEAEPGDKVAFGQYQWKVLEIDDDEALLVMNHTEKHEETRNGVYNNKLKEVTWADCSLRKWLNGEFLKKYFTDDERKHILSEEYENPGNETYGIDGGENTKDQVTLLTPEMYEQYTDTVKTFSMNFWLRAPGYTAQNAQFVSHRKQIMDYGYAVNSDQFYVIPVIKISLEGLK